MIIKASGLGYDQYIKPLRIQNMRHGRNATSWWYQAALYFSCFSRVADDAPGQDWVCKMELHAARQFDMTSPVRIVVGEGELHCPAP